MKRLEIEIGLRGTLGQFKQVKRTNKVAMYENDITGEIEVFKIQVVRACGNEWEMYPQADHFGTTAFRFPYLSDAAENLYNSLNQF